jgi:hypothetical protein
MKITLPEGYIFDILSIYQIKISKCAQEEDFIHLNNFNNLLNEIKSQIGDTLTDLIINSDEYKNLLIANLSTFELVDAVKTDACLGKEVDQANYKRFLAKKALQEKWFNNNYLEVKIGYNK